MEGLHRPARDRTLKLKLDVLRERLDRFNHSQRLVETKRRTTKELARLSDKQIIHINHRLTTRTHRNDREIEDHTIRPDHLDRVARFLIARRPNRNLRLHKHQSLPNLLPLRVHITSLQTRKDLAARDGHRKEVMLLLVPPRKLSEHLVGLVVDIEVVERAAASPRDDFGEPLRYILPVFVFFFRSRCTPAAASARHRCKSREVDRFLSTRIHWFVRHRHR